MKTVFVSSTFTDMQAERDLLNTRVLPAVNEAAKKYGDSVSFSDLRWGIHTGGLDEETAGKKILDACLYEIEGCRPYMIVFLGERYGWCPGEKLLRRAVEAHPTFSLADYGISATELEIEYGAFSDYERFSHTLFYFRAPSPELPREYIEANAEGAARLSALKERILAREGAHVYTYEIPWGGDTAAAYQALGERIAEDLCALFAEEWKRTEGLSPFEREKALALSYAASRAASFYERPSRLSEYRFLLNYCPFFLSGGGHGDGNTALLCKLITERHREGVHVLPILCGLSRHSTDVFSVARHIIRFLSEECGKDFLRHLPIEEDTEVYQTVLADALRACAGLEDKLEIIIDAIGVADDRGISELSDMPFFAREIPENVSFLIGAPFRDGFHAEHLYARPSISPMHADFFDKEHIAACMMREARKELDPALLALISQKAKNALHLRWMISRLSIMRRTDFERIAAAGGGMEAITAHQRALIEACPDSLEEMGIFLARTACESIGGKTASRILSYICASRDGLSEASLRYLIERRGLSWSGLDYRLLLQFLDDFLYLRADGKCVLLHPYVRCAFPVSDELYGELLDEISSRSPAGMDEEDVLDLVYYAVRANTAEAFVRCVITQREAWRTAARALLYALRFGIPVKSYYERDAFLEKWIRDSLAYADTVGAKDLFLRFFEKEYNEACANDVYYFRVMAHAVYGDWAEVNRISSRAKEKKREPRPCFTEEYERRFEELRKDFERREGAEAQKRPPRKERWVDPARRRGETVLEGRHFYLFFAEGQAFFFRDDALLLSTSGWDIESYELKYDEKSGALTLLQSSFDPRERETRMETFFFPSPFADVTPYTHSFEDLEGAHVLPIRP